MAANERSSAKVPRPPVPAATIILLRDAQPAGSGPEVLLLERHSKSNVLPDMYVFPGGRVEQSDTELAHRLGETPVASLAQRLWMVDSELAAAFCVAAIRETFEEAGILLARFRSSGESVGAPFLSQVRSERRSLQTGDRSFRDFVEEYDLDLDLAALSLHAHWVTPESVARRFDTLFFSALVPEGQVARHDGVEATSHVWIRPERALEEARSGSRQIVFPTACNLETLESFADAGSAWNASLARRVVTVLPRVELRNGKRCFVIPEEAGYRTSERPLT